MPPSLGVEVEPAEAIRVVPLHNANGACLSTSTSRSSTSSDLQCWVDDALNGVSVSRMDRSDTASLETYGLFARSETGLFAPSRQLFGSTPGMSNSGVIMMLGVRANLLEDRLKLGAEHGLSDRWFSFPTSSMLEHRRFAQQTGQATNLKVEAQLAKSRAFRWQMTGELSIVDDNYSIGDIPGLQQIFAIPGGRFSLTTSAKLAKTGIRASYSKLDTSFGGSQTMRAGINRSGLSLRIASRKSSVTPSLRTGFVESRTSGTSLYVDIEPTTLFPGLAASADPLPELLPVLLSIGIDTNQTKTVASGQFIRYRRSGWGLFGTWDSRLGDTMMDIRRESRRGLDDMPGEQTGQKSFMLTASHAIRHGNWRFGLDLFAMGNSASGSGGYAGRMFSIGPSISYRAEGGPEFTLGIGKDSGSSYSSDRSFVMDQSGSAITARLDLSKFLRRRFERNDLIFRTEYRKRLDASVTSYSPFDEQIERESAQRIREGLLVSFAAKL